MPQASDEDRKRWGGAQGVGEDKAEAYLKERGWKLNGHYQWVKPSVDHVVTEDEAGAIRFLIHEWDYDGIWLPTHRHFKGGLYRLLMSGIKSADNPNDLMVLYEDANGTPWARRQTEFYGVVNNPYADTSVPRFASLLPAPMPGTAPASVPDAATSPETSAAGRKPIDLPDDVW